MEKLHLQPTELDLLPFYEYEYTLEIQQTQETSDKYNMDGLKGQANRQMKSVKAPSMPQIRMPKL